MNLHQHGHKKKKRPQTLDFWYASPFSARLPLVHLQVDIIPFLLLRSIPCHRLLPLSCLLIIFSFRLLKGSSDLATTWTPFQRWNSRVRSMNGFPLFKKLIYLKQNSQEQETNKILTPFNIYQQSLYKSCYSVTTHKVNSQPAFLVHICWSSLWIETGPAIVEMKNIFPGKKRKEKKKLYKETKMKIHQKA